MRPLRVFLDSSDYSVLSTTREAIPDQDGILAQLVELADSGRVTFYFSGPLIAEMAPLAATYTSAAIGRAGILVRLCTRNCLVSPERLIAWELARALDRPHTLGSPYSADADWFPEGALDLLPLSPAEHVAAVDDVLKDKALNRTARRRLRQATTKRGKHRPEVRALLVNQARSITPEELRTHFPLKPDDARALARYVVGDLRKVCTDPGQVWLRPGGRVGTM